MTRRLAADLDRLAATLDDLTDRLAAVEVIVGVPVLVEDTPPPPPTDRDTRDTIDVYAADVLGIDTTAEANKSAALAAIAAALDGR